MILIVESSKEEYVGLRQLFHRLKPFLVRGIVVLKAPRNSFFKSMVNYNVMDKRRIRFEPPFVEFIWSSASDHSVKKRFKIEDLVKIVEGKRSSNFLRFNQAKNELCFSLFMKDRSIDLQCLREEDYKTLLSGFKLIMFLHKKFESNLFVIECLDDPLFDEKCFDEGEANGRKKSSSHNEYDEEMVF